MPKKLSLTKKLAFATLAVCLFFILAEASLALLGVQATAVSHDPLVGFSEVLPLFVSEGSGNRPAEMITVPNKRELFNVQRFQHPKPAGTYRIFCLGGSTTYGHPYDDRTSFAAWLRELLPCIDDSRKWEVINAGGISYASYREAVLVEELSQYDPDLFVVFTGHNEFLEERTYGDLRALPAALKQASGLLAHTRTYAAMRRLLTRPSPQPKPITLPAEVDAILDHSVGPSAYHRDERLRRSVVEHFEFNLKRMARQAHAAGARIVYVTPVSNLKDCSPFKSEHRADLSEEQRGRWSDSFRRARKLQAEGDMQAALTAFEDCLAVDDTYAELHYRRGQCLDVLDKQDEARAAFLQARDEDICPLRATTDLVAAVRRAAAVEQAPLLDFEAILEEECRRRFGHAIPGHEMFLDHVHPTVEIHGLLAMSLARKLVEMEIMPTLPDRDDRCAAAVTATMEDRLTPRDHAVAQRMIAKVFSWAGKIEEAGPAALAALEILPDDRESLFIAGAYLKSLGRDREGNEHYRRALEIEVAENPADVEARQFLAETLLDLGDTKAAEVQIDAALKLRPDSPEAARLKERLKASAAR